jgi:hypothetical protein
VPALVLVQLVLVLVSVVLVLVPILVLVPVLGHTSTSTSSSSDRSASATSSASTSTSTSIGNSISASTSTTSNSWFKSEGEELVLTQVLVSIHHNYDGLCVFSTSLLYDDSIGNSNLDHNYDMDPSSMLPLRPSACYYARIMMVRWLVAQMAPTQVSTSLNVFTY